MANVPGNPEESSPASNASGSASSGAAVSASGPDAWDTPSFEAEPGAAVGARYVLRRRLGAGGMGAVFAASDAERGAEVALKVLQRFEPRSIRRLKSEFRSLADISHPNLATLHELVSLGRQWFITMELVDGVDFLSWVWDRPRLPLPRPVTEVTGAPSRSAGAPPAGPAGPAGIVGSLAQGSAEEQLSTIVGQAPPRQAPRHRWDAEGRPARLDGQRLRAALRQLASGVAALHGAGKLHRDLKPSNVLVDRAGRVVVLDFGLVARVPRADGTEDDATVCGTPSYMAPEQAVAGRATTASDWYAFGGMLYEALTGRLPFTGDFRALVRQKVTSAPPAVGSLAPDAPADLAELAMALLDRDPRARPSGAEVLRRLGAPSASPLVASSEAPPTEAPLVGRQAELQALGEALAQSRKGRPAIVTVKGRSGMGKSAVLRAFCDQVSRDDLSALVLSGRCFERESVPFKAFDGVLDALAVHLGASSREGRAAVAPPAPAALERVFPAFENVFPYRVGDDESAGLAGRALRRRAIGALRHVLAGLARQGTVLIHLDDLQWSDPDSGELLAELIDGKDPPAVLWVLGFRAEEERGHAWLPELPRWIEAWGAAVAALSLVIEPLPEPEALALARARLGPHATPGRAEALVREAAGCPLLVDQIARFEAERGEGRAVGEGRTVAEARTVGEARSVGDAGPAVTLDDVVRTRVAGLVPDARALLARVAVAARPLAQEVVLSAAGLSSRQSDLLYALRNGNLVRTAGARGRDPVEAYHDRIGALVVASLAPEELRTCHADLAAAIGKAIGSGAPSAADVHALAFHTLGAGDDAAALGWTLRAAREARTRQAPREAARLLETALAIAGRLDDEAQVRALRPEIAECHRLAGTYDRALAWLSDALGAAERDGDAARAELLVARGRVHQEKGAHPAAVADLESALRLFGHRPPGGALSLVVHTAGQVLAHVLGWGARRKASREAGRVLERQAEVLHLLERIYYFTDVRKLVWAAFFGMNLARRSARDITASLAHGYFGALWFGLGRLARAERHCDRALALAKGSGDRMAEGVALERLGSLALFGNALDRATLLLGRAAAELRRVGEEWELSTSLMLEATACFLGGRLGRAVTLWEEMGALAQGSGNLVHRAWADAWAPYARYLQGQLGAVACREALERAVAASGSVGDVANQVAATAHLAALAVTEGDAAAAAGAARRVLETVDRYAVKVPFLHVGLLHAAEAALLAAKAATGRERKDLLALATGATRRVLALGKAFPYLVGPALRVQARQIALERGAEAARPVIGQALVRLDDSPNLLWRALAHREAALLGLDTAAMTGADHAARAAELLAEAGATRLLA